MNINEPLVAESLAVGSLKWLLGCRSAARGTLADCSDCRVNGENIRLFEIKLWRVASPSISAKAHFSGLREHRWRWWPAASPFSEGGLPCPRSLQKGPAARLPSEVAESRRALSGQQLTWCVNKQNMLLMKWHQVSQQNVFIVFSLKRVVFSLDLNSGKSHSETKVFTQALCEGTTRARSVVSATGVLRAGGVSSNISPRLVSGTMLPPVCNGWYHEMSVRSLFTQVK